MRTSKILSKLRAGRVARVCSLGAPISYFPTLAAHCGYDGIWVDAEHRAWDPREANHILLEHHSADIDCLYRAPSKEKNALYRLLEDGASGLMIPHVSTPEEAQTLVNAVKFPPLGDRGLCGGGRDTGYWIHKRPDYTEAANRETFLVVQIETPLALENADAIAAVPGVDVLFLGPGDLSLRLGCQPAVDDRHMHAVQARIAEAARNHGKHWGRPVGTAKDAAVILAQGAQLISFGSDFGGILQHLTACAADFDRLLDEATDSQGTDSGRTE